MKNLLFGLIATVMFGVIGFAKNQVSNVEPPSTFIRACVTLSCCGVGIFGVEIYSTTHCWSFNRSNIVITFDQPIKTKEVSVAYDTILSGSLSDKSEYVIIPAGRYNVVNNSISFVPVLLASRPWCITYSYSGDVLGNPHSGSTTSCYDWIWNKNNSLGLGNVTITPTLSAELKEALSKAGTLDYNITKDYIQKDANVNYTVKAGVYKLNADGKIYINNVKIR